MIKEQLLVGAKPTSSPLVRDRGLFKMLGDAWKEHSPVRLHADSPNHLAQVIETSPDFVFTIDEAGHLLYCNPTTRRTLGLGRGDLSKIHLSELYPARARTHILGEAIFSAILDGAWSGETTLLTRGGREIPVSQVIVAPLASDGRCEFLSVIARDISESKETEKARQEIATFYRRIVEAANIGIWIIDSENRTRFVNPRMEKLLNCPADEIVGKPIASFMDREELALAQARREAMRRDDAESQDYKLRRSDGAELWVRLSTSSLFDEQAQFLGTLALVAESTGFERVAESAGRFAIGVLT